MHSVNRSLPTSMNRLVDRTRNASRWATVDAILKQEDELAALDDQAIRKQSHALRYRAKSGEKLEQLVVDSFALVRAASQRVLGLKHYPVQLFGGLVMNAGCVAEMQTGEGKTLTATLPLYTAALSGRGAHLATANDYLARRDAETMTPLFELLGMSVGVVEGDTSRIERRSAYACDVTYGTAKEFGFDFLRDRLRMRDQHEGLVGDLPLWDASSRESRTGSSIQRPFHFGLIDEADSILIDEARTPLVVSSAPGSAGDKIEAICRWAAEHCEEFEEGDHFEWDASFRSLSLTVAGRERTRALPHPDELNTVGLIDIYDRVEKAILVAQRYHRDQHYIIRDEDAVIVDENTGRLAEGRKWRAGIHQAIEAKEAIPISPETGQAARITIQSLMRRYERLAGMTGTAQRSTAEFRKIYRMGVVRIPTHLPSQRKQLPDRVVHSVAQKWDAIVEEIGEFQALGRAVLVGTRTIEHSHELSKKLDEHQIEHHVLNATHLSHEAGIVAEAGQPSRVTVATNMAGRGTDIKLDDQVRDAGGLHVICTELHESQRIDRQLIGRSGRQGDPGSFRTYHCLEDEILKTGFGASYAKKLQRSYKNTAKLDGLARLFKQAQRKIECIHFRDRANLLRGERERISLHQQLGQDPYLDSPV